MWSGRCPPAGTPTLVAEPDFAVLRELAGPIRRQHYVEIVSAARIDYMLAARFSDEALRKHVRAADRSLEPLREPVSPVRSSGQSMRPTRAIASSLRRMADEQPTSRGVRRRAVVSSARADPVIGSCWRQRADSTTGPSTQPAISAASRMAAAGLRLRGRHRRGIRRPRPSTPVRTVSLRPTSCGRRLSASMRPSRRCPSPRPIAWPSPVWPAAAIL